MKKLIVFIIVLLVIIGGWSFYNKMRFEKCYMKITQNGKVETDITSSGNYKRYMYNLKAYDEKGNEVPVEFFANKNLRLNAYLCVKVFKPLNNNSNQIKGYEEVTKEQLPEKVKDRLGLNN